MRELTCEEMARVSGAGTLADVYAAMENYTGWPHIRLTPNFILSAFDILRIL